MKCKLNYIWHLIVVFTHCTVYIASDMSNISNGVHYGYLIYMEDGQVWAADSKKLAVKEGRAKWGICITWRIVDANGKQLFQTPKDETDIGIGELIAQYYAFKYLKHFPFTLEISRDHCHYRPHRYIPMH